MQILLRQQLKMRVRAVIMWLAPSVFIFVSAVVVAAPVFVEVTDPTEQAFRIKVPKGWNSQLGTARIGSNHTPRSWMNSTSPAGDTHIFVGDTRLPSFMLPGAYPMLEQFAHTDPSVAVSPYIEAAQFGANYAQLRFGQAENFRLTGSGPDTALDQHFRREFQAYGNQTYISAARVSFEFVESGKTIHGGLHVATILVQNSNWIASVSGFTTTAAASEADQTLQTVMYSFARNPQWQQQEHQRTQAAMAQSQANHQARMRANQQRFDAHQQMMQQRYDAADQQNQQWHQEQAIRDRGHEQFTDYIRDQQNVYNNNQQGKVDGYNEHIWVNPNTDEYIGTDDHFQDFRMEGFEEWQQGYPEQQ